MNFRKHSPQDIVIPAIVVFELKVGIAKSSSPGKRNRQWLEICQSIPILPFGEKEAQAAAAVRAELERKGQPIGPYDVLIAGMALANQATLVTRNLKEFKRIPKLKIENWYD